MTAGDLDRSHATRGGKKVKKLLSTMLALVLTGSLITACGQGDQDPSGSQGNSTDDTATGTDTNGNGNGDQTVTYPIEGGITLTYAIGEPTPVTVVNPYKDSPFIKRLEEATGITLEITHPADFAVLLASGNLPDIIANYNIGNYSGGPSQAIRDKIIHPLNDLIDEYAPDLKRLLDSNEEYQKVNSTPDGDIIGFPFIRGHEELRTSMGMIIRQDWLDDLGMEKPETPDEFYDVLKAFKDDKGATFPLSLTNWQLSAGLLEQGAVTSPFGLPAAGFYQIDNQIHYGYYEEAYKDVLAFMSKLHDDGLLDPDFPNIDGNTVNSNIMNGISGATVGPVGGGIGVYLSTMKDKDPNFNVTATGSLVANSGDRAMSGHLDNAIYGIAGYITESSQNKEAAAMFLNYGYTEEGHMLYNFGIEDESYTLVDGVPVFTDLITDHPDGLTMQQALAQYSRSYNHDSFVQDEEYIRQYAGLPQQQEAIAIWSETDAADYIIPHIVIAQEDSAEYSRLSGDINTYIGEMRVKFIIGLEPIENFDTYLSTLKDMGIERLIELRQKALDEFINR